MAGINVIKGRLALITGASSGIGAACARNLAGHGVHLALTYSKNLDGMRTVLNSIQSQNIRISNSPQRISIHQVDVSHADQIDRLFTEIARDHNDASPDILISNAGYGKKIPQIWDVSLEEFDRTININLRASFLLVKGVVEHMKAQRWGRIVFMSSIAAYGSGTNGAHYAASKGGLTGMMKSLATRLADYNISVNDVAPAMIYETGMIPDASAAPEVAVTIPLGRLGTVGEVANVVQMCVTTGYMTGQSIILGGGLKGF